MRGKILSVFFLIMTIFCINSASAEESISFSDISIENQDAVTLDLDLIDEFNGASVTWTSSDEDVISLEGEVMRPGVNSQPVVVKLTATVNGTSVEFYVTVLPYRNENEVLELSSSKLTFDTLSGDNMNSVKNTLTLPSKDKYGTVIRWESSDTGILKITPDGDGFKGEILQMGFSDGDCLVFLTATMFYGDTFTQKQFYIRIKEFSRIHSYSNNISGVVDEFNDLFTMNNRVYAVRDDLYLPTVNGVNITYASSDPDVVDETGKITRPIGSDKTVTFVVTLQKGYENTHIAYSLVVKPISDDEAAESLEEDLEWVINKISQSNLAAVTGNLALPTSAPNGAIIEYYSSNTAVLENNGNVTRGSADTDVNLRVRVRFADEYLEDTLTVRVKGITVVGGTTVDIGGGSSPAGPSAGGPTAPVPEVTPVAPKYTYSDVTPSHWAYNAIEDLTKRRIVDGNDDGTFGPDDSITREAFVKMLITAMNKPVSRYDTPFTDVSDGAWYYDYVATAVNSGIVNGIEDDFFGVGYNITRQDICVLICRAFYEGQTAEDASCNDFREVSDYAKTAVSVMYKNGILQGDDDGNFNPKATASRAEVAAIFSRLLSK